MGILMIIYGIHNVYLYVKYILPRYIFVMYICPDVDHGQAAAIDTIITLKMS